MRERERKRAMLPGVRFENVIENPAALAKLVSMSKMNNYSEFFHYRKNMSSFSIGFLFYK